MASVTPHARLQAREEGCGLGGGAFVEVIQDSMLRMLISCCLPFACALVPGVPPVNVTEEA